MNIENYGAYLGTNIKNTGNAWAYDTNTYDSLVFHPAVTTDDTGSFNYRWRAKATNAGTWDNQFDVEMDTSDVTLSVTTGDLILSPQSGSEVVVTGHIARTSRLRFLSDNEFYFRNRADTDWQTIYGKFNDQSSNLYNDSLETLRVLENTESGHINYQPLIDIGIAETVTDNGVETNFTDIGSMLYFLASAIQEEDNITVQFNDKEANDIAEWLPSVQTYDNYENGDLICASTDLKVDKCNNEYDRLVIGIVNFNPSFFSNERNLTINPYNVPVITSGFGYVKADCDQAIITNGDLLTSSPTTGHAQSFMKYNATSTIQLQQFMSATFGKAMQDCESGQQLIGVWVN